MNRGLRSVKMTLTFYEYHILEAHIVVLCEILLPMHCNCMELRIKLLMTKSSFEIMKDSKSFCTFSQLNETQICFWRVLDLGSLDLLTCFILRKMQILVQKIRLSG